MHSKVIFSALGAKDGDVVECTDGDEGRGVWSDSAETLLAAVSRLLIKDSRTVTRFLESLLDLIGNFIPGLFKMNGKPDLGLFQFYLSNEQFWAALYHFFRKFSMKHFPARKKNLFRISVVI